MNEHPFSTFSIDVDTGACSNMRRMLQAGKLDLLKSGLELPGKQLDGDDRVMRVVYAGASIVVAA